MAKKTENIVYQDSNVLSLNHFLGKFCGIVLHTAVEATCIFLRYNLNGIRNRILRKFFIAIGEYNVTFEIVNFLTKTHCHVAFDTSPFDCQHVVVVVLSQFLEGAHLRFPVSGRQIRNDTRIVGVDNDNCDEAPSEGQNTNRTAHPCVTVSYFNNWNFQFDFITRRWMQSIDFYLVERSL